MSATPIAASERYFAPNITKGYFVPSISSKAAPTRPELDAGIDLTGEISAVSGWTVTGATVDAPDYGSLFTGQVPARTTAAASSINCYASQNTVDVREVLPRGTVGFMVWLWGGDVTGQKMDVYPVRVTTVGKTMPDNAASDLQVSFAISSEPAEDVAIP